MCFDPKRDGRPIWGAIHLFAANAETLPQQLAFIQFIRSLPVMYPCKKCRLHTEAFLQETPVEPYVESAQRLLYWTWLFHESVNRKLNKPLSQRLTWEQTRTLYMAECEDTTREETNHPTSKSGDAKCGECELDHEEPPQQTSSKMSSSNKEKVQTRAKQVFVRDNEYE